MKINCLSGQYSMLMFLLQTLFFVWLLFYHSCHLSRLPEFFIGVLFFSFLISSLIKNIFFSFPTSLNSFNVNNFVFLVFICMLFKRKNSSAIFNVFFSNFLLVIQVVSSIKTKAGILSAKFLYFLLINLFGS